MSATMIAHLAEIQQLKDALASKNEETLTALDFAQDAVRALVAENDALKAEIDGLKVRAGRVFDAAYNAACEFQVRLSVAERERDEARAARK